MISQSVFGSNRLTLLGAALLGVCLSGCGVDSSVLPTNASVSTLKGIAHGGPNPIVGATVNYYATASGSYGATATLLSTAVTQPDGSFSFVSPLACTSGQQAYVTAQGGNPGAGTNPNYLLVAALGPCANISASTNIWISEATTVAAAYALRPFVSLAGTAGAVTVNIGAPANNNATSGTCTTASGATTACAAAGLAHAFQNALNLVSSVTVNGVAPTGAVYTVTPSNAGGSVPQALINSIANSVEACVNSTGGTTGDGSSCGTLFQATTPAVSGGTAPTNTFQALLDLAQYPTLTPTNVSTLYKMAPPNSFYLPALTSTPTDFSLAIAYSGLSVSGQVTSVAVGTLGSGYSAPVAVTFSAPTSGTTATGTALMGVGSVSFTANTTGTCTSPKVVFSSAGATTVATASATASGGKINSVTITNPGVGYTSAPTITFTGTGCITGAGTSTLGVADVLVTNGGSGYTTAPTVSFPTTTGTTPVATATDGSITNFSYPSVLSLDAADNLYVVSQNLSSGALYGFITSMSSNGTPGFVGQQNTLLSNLKGAATDTLGNLWLTNNTSPTNAIEQWSVNSSGALTAPSNTTNFSPTNAGYSIAVDMQNNVWFGFAAAAATQKINELLQASSYAANTNLGANATNAYAQRAIAIDSNQDVFLVGYNATANVASVIPNTGSISVPSYSANSGSIVSPAIGNSGEGIALDSSNNAWIPTASGLYAVSPTYASGTTPPITGLSASSVVSGTTEATPTFDSVDGAGSVWLPNGTVIQELASGTAYSYAPCYAPAGATTCANNLGTAQKSQSDSTGSVWVISTSTSTVYQLLGTGAPTWPELSYTHPGVLPQ